MSGVSLHAVSASEKATICHKSRTITVSMSAISAHEKHGDTLGECTETEKQSASSAANSAVVMMRCGATADNGMVVVSLSASFEFASTQPVEPVDCAVALADSLDAGLKLKSVTGGSSGDSNGMELYTDYLLIGKAPQE